VSVMTRPPHRHRNNPSPSEPIVGVRSTREATSRSHNRGGGTVSADKHRHQHVDRITHHSNGRGLSIRRAGGRRSTQAATSRNQHWPTDTGGFVFFFRDQPRQTTPSPDHPHRQATVRSGGGWTRPTRTTCVYVTNFGRPPVSVINPPHNTVHRIHHRLATVRARGGVDLHHRRHYAHQYGDGKCSACSVG